MNFRFAFSNRQFFALLFCVVLIGCAPHSTPPSEDSLSEYMPPAPSAKNATITGSLVNPGLIQANQYWHVTEIDGVFVKDKECSYVQSMRNCYNHTILLEPGMHTVTVLATNGYGVTRSLIVLDAKPGAHYIVKGSMTAYWTINLTERPYSISWIEDTADNSVVTEKEKATLTPLPPPVVIVR